MDYCISAVLGIYGELTEPRIIWTLTGVIGFIVILCSAIMTQLEVEAARKHTEARARQAAIRIRQAAVYCRPRIG
jgi:hypothetical protein